jgi:hypothetical protein
MKICTYTMTGDTGFAPNPYHGFCTLTACTPNHMNARLQSGDLIAGFRRVADRPCLVYWMEVAEVLDYANYSLDARFTEKKPRMNGTWKTRCGDNIYYRDANGRWQQLETIHHAEKAQKDKDLRHPVVYVASRFSYHGGLASPENTGLPCRLVGVMKSCRGIKYCRETDPLFPAFRQWLLAFPEGVLARPQEWRENAKPVDFRTGRCKTTTCPADGPSCR